MIFEDTHIKCLITGNFRLNQYDIFYYISVYQCVMVYCIVFVVVGKLKSDELIS
jgi:hypothetical protein